MKRKLLLSIACIGMTFASISQNIADFTLTDTKGNTHQLYSYLSANKFVVLKFWFRSCPNCQDFSTKFEQLYQDFGQNGGDVIFLSLEIQEATNAEIDTWLSQEGVTYPACGGSVPYNYWGSEWYPILGGGFTQAVIIRPNADDPSASTVAYTKTGYVAPSDVTEMRSVLAEAGVKQLDEDQFISVYPVPASEKLTVSLDEHNSLTGSMIRLFDLTGKLVFEGSNFSDKMEIEVSTLDKGFYTLTVENEQFTASKKVQVME